MRKSLLSTVLMGAALLSFASAAFGQDVRRGNAPAPSVPHDPKDLSGVWAKTWRTLSLNDAPPPFTPRGKQLFDANKPSYGPRAVPPALGNDPTGNCDPLGLVRNLLLEVS